MDKEKANFDKHKFSYQNTKHKISYQKATLIYRITKHSNNKYPDRYFDTYKTDVQAWADPNHDSTTRYGTYKTHFIPSIKTNYY